MSNCATVRCLILLLSFGMSATVHAAQVHEHTLDNGLKVLVQVDDRAPVVVSQIWYKVGSSYEPPGITGISHMLEHMMFQGTETVGPGEFSRRIAEQGGSQNAFTGRDYTAYFEQLSSDQLPLAFELEADRMRNLLLAETAFATERQVVQEERRLRVEDDPRSLTGEQAQAVAFTVSPYGHPIIGWMADIDAYTLADLAQWYQRWYGPNNATLVVVGDVQADAVFDLAETHFGSIPPIDLQPPRGLTEPPQRGPRRVTVKAPAELPYLIVGYKVPSLHSAQAPWEAYALEALAGVLDGGRSARIERELVRGSGVAVGAGASYSLTSRLDDLFSLAGIPSSGSDMAALEAAFDDQVARLKAEPVNKDELQRVIAQVIASDVYQRDSQFYQAMRLGTTETVGLGYRRLDDYIERMQAVTPEQIQQVAQRYLIDERKTVAVLEPQSMETGSDEPSQSPSAAEAVQ